MHVFVYCIRICIYTFNVYTHMFIQKSSVCIDRDTYMRALCREVQKEGSMIYMFIYCIRICIHTNTHIQIRILYKQKSFVCINKFTFMRALCRKVQKEGSVIYMFTYGVRICTYARMFIQKSSVCMDKCTYMRALCREVQKEGSVMYIFKSCVRICAHSYVYTEELCMYG